MDDIKRLADILCDARHAVFFGGAGVSTESGIPDFRGTNGLYKAEEADGIPPEVKLHCQFLARYPERFFDYYRTHMIHSDARPNAAHLALSKLEEMGKLDAVITQNIDGLHQLAGSRTVIELHGSTLRNDCVRCGRRYGLDVILNGDTAVPTCICGGMIRPDVVLYGEPLDADIWDAAEKAVRAADVMLVGGTSLTVHPAAGFVGMFRGEHLVIINREATPYDDRAELVIREPIGIVMSRVTALLGE